MRQSYLTRKEKLTKNKDIIGIIKISFVITKIETFRTRSVTNSQLMERIANHGLRLPMGRSESRGFYLYVHDILSYIIY